MIPEPPRVSYWEASPHLQRFCRRKLGDAAWRWAEPRLASMGERAGRIHLADIGLPAELYRRLGVEVEAPFAHGRIVRLEPDR